VLHLWTFFYDVWCGFHSISWTSTLFVVCTAKEGVSLNFIIVKCILWWLYWAPVINLGMDRCWFSTVPGNNEFYYSAPKIWPRGSILLYLIFHLCSICTPSHELRCRTVCRSVKSYFKDQTPRWRTSASHVTCIFISAVTLASYVSEAFLLFLPTCCG